jgi:selenocysteine-specific elongation factor
MHLVDGFARMRLDRSVPLVPGDRLVLRDPGRSAVIGAVEVLDVDPSKRLDPDRLRTPVVEQRFLGEPWQRRDDLGPTTGLDDATLTAHLRHLAARGEIVDLDPWFVRADEHERVAQALADTVAERAQPLADVAAAVGLTRVQTMALAQRLPPVRLDGNIVRHRDATDTAATPAGRAVLDRLRSAPFAPPDPRGVVDDPGVLTALVREGAVTKCDDIWFATDALARAADLVVAALVTTPQLAVSDLRDLFGSSRKYTIAIAGWLDTTGVTRRQGDQRVRGAAPAPGERVS